MTNTDSRVNAPIEGRHPPLSHAEDLGDVWQDVGDAIVGGLETEIIMAELDAERAGLPFARPEAAQFSCDVRLGDQWTTMVLEAPMLRAEQELVVKAYMDPATRTITGLDIYPVGALEASPPQSTQPTARGQAADGDRFRRLFSQFAFNRVRPELLPFVTRTARRRDALPVSTAVPRAAARPDKEAWEFGGSIEEVVLAVACWLRLRPDEQEWVRRGCSCWRGLFASSASFFERHARRWNSLAKRHDGERRAYAKI